MASVFSSRKFVACVSLLLAASLALLTFFCLSDPGSLSAKGTAQIYQWGLNDLHQSTPLAGNYYKQVASGWHHTIALKVDGTIVGWGDNTYGQTTVPAGNDYVAIAANWNHCLALHVNGTVEAWGDNSKHQADKPAGNDYKAIAAGQFHSVALHADGSITAWGDASSNKTAAPAGKYWTGIAAGFSHSVALKYDGTLQGWGDDSAHQYDFGTSSGYKSVSAGELHTVALKNDGTIMAWGKDDFGQVSGRPTAGGYSQIASGAVHNLAIKPDGTTTAWGSDYEQQCDIPAGVKFSSVNCGSYNSTGMRAASNGKGWGDNSSGQSAFPAGNDFVTISAGTYYSVAIKADGSLTQWGLASMPAVPTGNNYIAVSAGASHGLALRADGSIMGWGDNSKGEITIPSPNNSFVAVAAGNQFSLALRSNGTAVGWGNNPDHRANPPASTDYISIAAGDAHGLGIRVDGTLLAWGRNEHGEVANKPAGGDYVQVSAGYDWSMALHAAGTIAAWGYDSDHQVSQIAAPNSGFCEISAGYNSGVALRSTGALAAWGWSSPSSPAPAGNVFSDIAAGRNHGLALCACSQVKASVDGANGSVSPATQNVLDGAGASVTLTPASGYMISTLTDNGVSKPAVSPYVISNVREDHNVVVTFASSTHTVSASVTGGHGSVSPASQSVQDGGSASITMNPDSTYKLATISDNGVSKPLASPYVITGVHEDHAVQVTYVLSTHAVNASVTGGGGTVAPPTQTIVDGSPATITITPDSTHKVASISDNGAQKTVAGTYTISAVREDHNVVVTFAVSAYVVSASVSGGGGTVAPASQTIAQGANASITITPDATHKIGTITDNNTSKPLANPYIITNVTQAHNVVVTFADNTHAVNASVTGGGGTLDPASQRIVDGSSATITLTPDASHRVATITDNGASMPVVEPYVIGSVKEDHAVFVTFEIDTYTVTASVSGLGGTVAPPEQTVTEGDSAIITITPDATHVIATVTDNGVSKPAVSPYVIANVREAHGVVVTFSDNTRLVTASVQGDGGQVDPVQQQVVVGNDAVVNLTPDANHHIQSITDNGVAVPVDNPYQVLDVQVDHLVVVTFGLDRFTVTGVVNGGHGTITPPTQSVAYGDSASVTMVPDPGYHLATLIDQWGGNNSNGNPPIPNPWVIQSVTANHTVTVTFAIDTFTVDATAGANGNVGPASQTVDYGTDTVVQVWAAPTYHIASIIDNGDYQVVTDPYDMAYTIPAINADHVVSATFKLNDNTVMARVLGGHGSVDPTSQEVTNGSSASITATPDEGYHVIAIRDNSVFVAVQDPYIINSVTSDHDVVFVFARNRFDISAAAVGTGGTVTPDTQRVPWSDAAVIEITPDTGYSIETITDNNVSVPVAAPYIINNVTGEHLVIVSFSLNGNLVNATVMGGHGTASPASQAIPYGSSASISFTPVTGYHIASLTDNSAPVTIANPYVIDPVIDAHEVFVTFAINTYAVTGTVSGGGGTVTPATQTLDYGSAADLTVTASSGHHISSITDNGSPVTITNTHSTPVHVANVTSSRAVVARFADDGPVIASVSPSSGARGARVTIKGEMFGGSRAGSTVTFNGAAVTGYVSWSDGQVVVLVPQNATTGPVQVTTAAGGSNKDKTFTLVSPFWYLAEGSTAYGFDTYVTIENPNDSTVTAVIDYMTANGKKTRPDISLPPMSQTVLDPRSDIGAIDFSTKVSCKEGKTIAVDRRMRWQAPGAPSGEGHCSVAVPAPETSWYLPEGCSDYGFECWLLIQNPGAAAAKCKVTYMIEGEAPRSFDKTIAPYSRSSYSMFEDIGAKNASIKVDSDTPVIPERSMYRNNRREGHDSIGTVAPARSYYLAEGTTSWGFTTYVLVQNPNAQEASVTLTYMTSNGPVTQAPFNMPAQSRKTVRVNDSMPNKDFSTQVDGNVPIIAERAMYWGSDTSLGEACHDSIGLAAPHSVFYLPDGESQNGNETYTLIGNPNGSAVQVRISYLLPGGKPAVSFTTTVPADSRATYNMSDKVPSGRASVMVESLTSGKNVLVERSMYWSSRGAGTNTIGCY